MHRSPTIVWLAEGDELEGNVVCLSLLALRYGRFNKVARQET